ncbi:sensor histidine kinase [Christensenella intestinihominis]|uniref:sensor histidine kinase n=1 Tax=Christensenella intestinihominis TaxID=1851429 RepID=UPI0009F25419|nr:sensor histidine kinase [Christensenella intestinihominis]
MPKFFTSFKKRIEKLVSGVSSRKIGTGLTVLLVACAAIFVALPVAYTLFSSETLHQQRLALGRAEANLAFQELDLLWGGAPPEDNFDDYSGRLVLTDQSGKIIFSSVPDLDGQTVEDGDSTVFSHSLANGITAYYLYPSYRMDMVVAVWISIAYVAVFICILFVIKRKMYDPIAKVERILHGVIEGETDFTFDAARRNDPFSPIFSDLHTLFENMKALTLRESNAQLMKKQAELDALQSQINPHFLYNTLEAIRGQAIEYGLQDIEMMTRSLSKLFRYSISNHNTLVTLREELDNVDNYLYIQHLRFNNKFTKISRIDEDALDYLVPKLIIQPIVENAIYHGLEMKIGQGKIMISAYITETRLIIDIQDDGLGISEENLRKLNATLSEGNTQIKPHTKGSSIGLRNVNARIRLTFGEDYGISVYSTEGTGTDVQLKLPLTK